MTRKFRRRVEDFTCENCGKPVTGGGYTNHCPACLWSQHVDINPGDRAEDCGGMMEPATVEKKGDMYRILHRCVVCRVERWNKASKEDDFEMILQVAAGQKGF